MVGQPAPASHRRFGRERRLRGGGGACLAGSSSAGCGAQAGQWRQVTRKWAGRESRHECGWMLRPKRQGLQRLCKSIQFNRAGQLLFGKNPMRRRESESRVSRYKVPGGVGLETKNSQVWQQGNPLDTVVRFFGLMDFPARPDQRFVPF